ncbi:MAG TPA: serine/threonine-protein kinase [Kofleriaceae bacterium]|nr:serine/threonine-protein kinase [Kofleriaceae bacterium]
MEIGELLAGKYRVERVLGRGGQGEVVQATNLLLGQSVAMKFLLPHMASQPVIVQRFVREARAAVQLKSEHVARVLDVGTLDNASPYIVFEYLDGADLTQVPREQLPLGVMVDFMLQACEALAEAHSKGVVHRDIKPANLFITSASDGSPVLKVLDFGISKVDAAGLPTLTSSFTMMGTPRYSSPEQLMATNNVDHRTDIWSIGVVLYEFVQGQPPYDADSLTQLAMKVMTTPLPPITKQIPPPLNAVITRCLEKDPALRFQSMGELARALLPFASSAEQGAMLATRASRNSMPLVEGSAQHPALPALSNPPTIQPTKRRSWLVAAIAAVVCGGAAMGVFVGRGHETQAKPVDKTAKTEGSDDTTEVHEMVVTAPVDAQAEATADAAEAADARDDRGEQAEKRVAAALAAVVARTKSHPTESCPTLASMPESVERTDPWGIILVITCTDQPADQIAGVISSGPDRELGTADDVKSWSLAPEVVAVAKGSPFTGKAGTTKTAVTKTTGTKTTKTTRTTKTSGTGKKGTGKGTASGAGTPAIVDRDGDGIPDVR